MTMKRPLAALAVLLSLIAAADAGQSVEWPQRWAAVLEETQSLVGEFVATSHEKCAQPPNAPSSPFIRKRREPRYPKAALRAASGGILIIQVELDPKGRPVRPQLLRRQPGALVYSALEALRGWRFEAKPNAGDLPVRVLFRFG
jgi:TonB family protein